MIYVLAEKEFLNYPWCQRTLQGIGEEARKKRIAIRRIDCPEDAVHPDSCILLVGASGQWNRQMIARSKACALKPVILSNQQHIPDQTVSSVMMDIHSSMALAVDYLHALGRKQLALYGVNPSASSDPWRASRFQELTGRAEHIFTLESSAEDAFLKFYQVIDRYDGVICTNDYAAVSLIRRLKEKDFALPEKLYIVSYGDMYLSKLSRPSITSISDRYEAFGRTALSVCGMLARNEAVSSVKVNLNSQLHIRETTGNRPFAEAKACDVVQEVQTNRFYNDLEITDLAKLETLFNQCDETDFSILQLVQQDVPYSVIAQHCFISETTAKYRVRKMLQICDVESKEMLAAYLRRFF